MILTFSYSVAGLWRSDVVDKREFLELFGDIINNAKN
jgi:hypothetical protein